MEFSEEIDLIHKAAQGNRDAFKRIVEKNQAFAYSLAYKLTGNRQDAEDMVQESFVRVWKNLGRYRPEIKFRTWLYTIVTNRCLDFLKSAKRRKRYDHASVEAVLQLVSSATAEVELHTQELLTIVLSIAEQLTPKQRAAFTLCDLEGLSLAEAGEVLTMSTGNLKSNLFYARKKVSEQVREFYKEQKISRHELR